MSLSRRASTAIVVLGTLGLASSAALAGPPAKGSAAPRPGAPPAAAPAPGGRTGDAAPATASPASEGGVSGLGIAILGGVVLLGVGGFLAWRAMSGGGGRGDGRAPEPILAERAHEWELLMNEEQEKALLAGVQAWRDAPGHSLYLSHGDGLITFYEPRRMLVSLHQLAGAFVAAGPAAVADPVAWVRGVFDGFAASEAPGVLHLRSDWYSPPLLGLDHQKFTDICYDTLTNPRPYVEGTQGSSADENSGHLTLKVEVGGPLNTLCVDLSRVLPHVASALAATPGKPLVDIVRPVLTGISRGELPGGMWTRGAASEAEQGLVARVVAAGTPRD